MITAFFAAAWALLKRVPWQIYVGIGVLVLLIIGINAWIDSIQAAQKRLDDKALAVVQSQLDAATQANSANASAITTLQNSLAECERNRLAEVAQTAEVKATYAKQIELFKQTDAKAHASTALRLASTCKDIAHQPTCVTAAP